MENCKINHEGSMGNQMSTSSLCGAALFSSLKLAICTSLLSLLPPKPHDLQRTTGARELLACTSRKNWTTLETGERSGGSFVRRLKRNEDIAGGDQEVGEAVRKGGSTREV